MSLTLGEIRSLEYKEIQERREKLKEELKKELERTLDIDLIEVLSISEREDHYKVEVAFTLDDYRQVDDFYWNNNESKEQFIEGVKEWIDYIKELRERYPELAKQNDYIQKNSEFKKKITLTHMGYERTFEISLRLADYLKLPNQTSVSFGGGDEEIKRTPRRVEEYNKNIDIVIDALLDCISELKQRKYTD